MTEGFGSLDHSIRMFDEALDTGARAFAVAQQMLETQTGRSAGAQEAAQAALQAFSDAIQVFAGISRDPEYMRPKGAGAPPLADAITADLDRLTRELNTFVLPGSDRAYRIDLAQVISKYIGETEKNWKALQAL